ncbi:protein disulfide isomerase-like 1-4 [Pyrus ussuriensis x Pyrus communis]|uniref:Protein disulfide isomerase-like 1-4 n=1 Tax=Pyrus ussuriensis x Pyrus communis TaxID=2448454 RepID=A0A5N5G0R7_9ROSA|nr:protein disulfide isomerase-like 1-4 [Pyrus ussuriensis x Pyrus communis]
MDIGGYHPSTWKKMGNTVQLKNQIRTQQFGEKWFAIHHHLQRPIPTTNGHSLPIDDDDDDFSFHEDPTDHSAPTPHHPDPDNYDDIENSSDVNKDAFRRWMAGLAAPRLLAGLMPFSVMD